MIVQNGIKVLQSIDIFMKLIYIIWRRFLLTISLTCIFTGGLVLEKVLRLDCCPVTVQTMTD